MSQDNTEKNTLSSTIGAVFNGKNNVDIEVKKNKKPHPLGELVEVKVHSLSPTDKKSQVFVSINQFNFEFQQNTKIKLPKEVVRFLQGATKIVHTVDKDNKPVGKSEPLYAVTVIV